MEAVGGLRISVCQTAQDIRFFERVPEILHGNQKAFVPSFPGAVMKYFSPKSAFRKRHGEIQGFLAFKGGRVVGRIAAILNRSHNEYWGDRAGFFGFFDCEDSQLVARELIKAAENFLVNRGMDEMRGPYNPTINDECGLLVEGFDELPYVGLTWNPPFYRRLVEGAGLQPLVRSFGFRLALGELAPPPRLRPIAQRVARRANVRLRPVDLANLSMELEVIREVYNETLRGNVGFVPIEREDLEEAARELAPILQRELVMVAERNGERAAVALSLPNINEHLVRMKQTPRWMRPAHFLWLSKRRRIRSGRQVVYGVSSRHRDTGIHGWLAYEHFVQAKRLLDQAELGWIQENNREILAAAELVGGKKNREWLIYHKAISSESAAGSV